MTALTPDETLRWKVALYRWFVRNGHSSDLVPGFRAYQRNPNGSISAVKTCGPQCREQLAVFRKLAELPGPALFDEKVREALTPYAPTLEVLPGPVRRPPVGQLLRQDVTAHGTATKNLIVLHQTISPDAPGMLDIRSVAEYLVHTGYGIHAIVDAEGLAAAVEPQDEEDIFWHASSGVGNVNTRGIGIEQVAYTGDVPYWVGRAAQLDATARWCAYFCKRHGIPPIYTPTCTSGICGHWDVTRTFLNGQGHYDCRQPPYPTSEVAVKAAEYVAKGWA